MRPTALPGSLEAFMALREHLPQLVLHRDVAFWACDHEKFLMCDTYGRFAISLKPGDPLTPGGTPAQVLRSQTPVAQYVPAEVYGFPCFTTAYPVPGGVIGISHSVEEDAQLEQALEELEGQVSQISTASREIAGMAQGVSRYIADLTVNATETYQNLSALTALSDLIEHLAKQSRFISLNALVESARAGDEGATFAVVAEQMQALTDKTTHSIKDVRAAVEHIHALVEQVRTHVAQAEKALQSQSSDTQEISVVIQNLNHSVQAITQLARRNTRA